ncbi:MAG: DUF1559 domain-containing protein, partial [Lentisphaeria bacterium]|nr:DUF1559 domain-containing protein [Lentisphaeria bacterium]
MNKKYRFSLIELLVVISIIGILTSLLLPSLSQAREVGQKTVCISNSKQILLAMNAYAADYNDYVPWVVLDEAGVYFPTVTSLSFDDQLAPYTKRSLTQEQIAKINLKISDLEDDKIGVWQCPSDNREFGTQEYMRRSYGIHESRQADSLPPWHWRD